MTTKEGSSYQNSIRFHNGTTPRYEKAYNVFKNQIPGTYVTDTLVVTWRCTNYIGANGEPIWARVDADGKEDGAYGILVNAGKKTTSDSSATGSTGITYNSETIKQRLSTRTKIQSYSTSWGSFFFIHLSEADKAKMNGEPYGSSTVTDKESIDDLSTALYTWDSIVRINELYEHIKRQTNGRSGAGAPAKPDMGYHGTTDYAYKTPRQLEEEQRQQNGTTNGRGGMGSPGTVNTNPSTGRGGMGSAGSSSTATGETQNNGTPPKSTVTGKTTQANGSSTPATTTSSPKITTIKLLPDYIVNTGANSFNLPYMKQVINNFDFVTNSRQRIERIHVFDVVPNSFEFSQMSSQWNEVDRSGNYPLVDWARYNLTKVSFKFLVVEQKLETQVEKNTAGKIIKSTSSLVNDGLVVSVDEQLDNIRAMLGAPQPITMYNLNSLMTTSYRFPYINNTRNIQWVINDASITATRLTPGGNHISAAEVSITLTEYPLVAREIIPLPPLKPDKPTPKLCPPGSDKPECKPANPQYSLWTGTYIFDKDGNAQFPPGLAN